MNFKEYYQLYTEIGFKPLRCKGYNLEINPTKERPLAKQPHQKGFTQDNFKGLTLIECTEWLSNDGWIGWVIPKNYITLDVDKRDDFTKQLSLYIKENKLFPLVDYSSKNKLHITFKLPESLKIKGGTDERIKLGINGVTFRHGGKNILILPPQEPERRWHEHYNIRKYKQISYFPDIFNILDLKKITIAELITALIWQISYYRNNSDYIEGYNDIELCILHFLLIELGLDTTIIHSHIQTIFKDKYDTARVEYALTRLRDNEIENPVTINTFVRKIKDGLWNSLSHIVDLIQDIRNKNKYLNTDEVKTETRLIEFSKKYSQINLDGNSYILEDRAQSKDESDLIFHKKNQLKEFMADEKPIFTQLNGKKKTIHIVDYWLNTDCSNKRKYTKIVLEPNPSKVKVNEYNLWKDYKVLPKEGDCVLFLALIEDVIAHNNEPLYKYILDWMADAIQNPTNRPGIALAIHGKQGAGKSMFARIFGYLYGQHFKHITSLDSIAGRFNSSLKDKLLVFVDEMDYSDACKNAKGRLKSYITEPTLDIEAKGKDSYTLNNNMRFIFAGNAENIVPVDVSDRRFCVMRASSKFKDLPEFFGDIQTQMDNGGYEALLYLLQNRDISKVNLRDIPKTSSRSAHIESSLDPMNKFIALLFDSQALEDIYDTFNQYKDIDKLSEMSGYTSDNTIFEKPISKKFLYKIYTIYKNDRYLESDKMLCKRLRDICKPIDKQCRIKGVSRSAFVLPTAQECKTRFNEYVEYEYFDLRENPETAEKVLITNKEMF